MSFTGRDARYGEQQILYHYTKKRELLDSLARARTPAAADAAATATDAEQDEQGPPAASPPTSAEEQRHSAASSASTAGPLLGKEESLRALK